MLIQKFVELFGKLNPHKLLFTKHPLVLSAVPELVKLVWSFSSGLIDEWFGKPIPHELLFFKHSFVISAASVVVKLFSNFSSGFTVIKVTKVKLNFKFSLYSQYYAEACVTGGGQSP